MAGGDEVVVVTSLLVEGTELDETVAHHVGVGGQTRAYLIHRVARHLVPVLTMAVDDLQPTAVLMADGCCHLEVFLRGAVPFFFLLWTYLNIETVGMQPLAHQFVEHHAAVDAPREQYRYSLVFQIHGCKGTKKS